MLTHRDTVTISPGLQGYSQVAKRAARHKRCQLLAGVYRAHKHPKTIISIFRLVYWKKACSCTSQSGPQTDLWLGCQRLGSSCAPNVSFVDIPHVRPGGRSLWSWWRHLGISNAGERPDFEIIVLTTEVCYGWFTTVQSAFPEDNNQCNHGSAKHGFNGHSQRSSNDPYCFHSFDRESRGQPLLPAASSQNERRSVVRRTISNRVQVRIFR